MCWWGIASYLECSLYERTGGIKNHSNAARSDTGLRRNYSLLAAAISRFQTLARLRRTMGFWGWMPKE
jgi:hypothetical protein